MNYAGPIALGRAMTTHVYEYGLCRVSEGLAALRRPSRNEVDHLAGHLRMIASESSRLGRGDLLQAANEAEAATRELLEGSANSHIPCVRAVYHLGHLLLLALRTDAEKPVNHEKNREWAERRLLVVDDSRVSAVALSNAFVSQGFFVRSVATMEEALVELTAFRPSVLVSDVHMPNLDVSILSAVYRQLSAGNRAIIVLISGTKGDELEACLAKVKPDAFVPKMAGTAPVVDCVLKLWEQHNAGGTE